MRLTSRTAHRGDHVTIQLLETAFDRGLRDVHAAADRLRHDRDHVVRQVDSLLDGGWSGGAATAFGGTFDDWRRAARDVLDGLTAMGELMGAAEAGLLGSDTSSAAGLREVSARIVERLGP